ncbi:ribose-phosphate pyrophosphokinase [Candidatus Sumerlaeota bacterium]|nr:ribose-phosphate pyrophosphokinase [Candidatus Sumerlaeota bacterium]
MDTYPQVFAGSASAELTRAICDYLGTESGGCEARKFSDGETWVKINENVRGKRCFVVQSTSSPVNDNLVELLMLIDALKRASAASVTAVIPYFGYARQDRKDQGRVALTAKMVANMIAVAGATRALTMDMHSEQIQGFFDIPVDHMYASPVLLEHVRGMKIPDLVVVSPDVGNVKRARNYASVLDVPLVIIEKRRPAANASEVLNVIGDVEGCNAFLFDDLIDTAGTICNAASALRERGAREVYAACTHGVLSGRAREAVAESGLKRIFVTDTIAAPNGKPGDKIEVVSIAPLLGEAIRRIHSDRSVSALFEKVL